MLQEPLVLKESKGYKETRNPRIQGEQGIQGIQGETGTFDTSSFGDLMPYLTALQPVRIHLILKGKFFQLLLDSSKWKEECRITLAE